MHTGALRSLKKCLMTKDGRDIGISGVNGYFASLCYGVISNLSMSPISCRSTEVTRLYSGIRILQVYKCHGIMRMLHSHNTIALPENPFFTYHSYAIFLDKIAQKDRECVAKNG